MNGDGYIDIIKSHTSDGQDIIWINNKTGNWTVDTAWNFPEYFVEGVQGDDLGVRLADVNNDGFTDVIKAHNGNRKVYINNGTDWNNEGWIFPTDFVDAPKLDEGVRLLELNGDGCIDVIHARQTISKSAFINNCSGGWITDYSWNIPVDVIEIDRGDLGTRFADVNGDGLTDILHGFELMEQKVTYLNNGSGWHNDTNWETPTYFTTGTHKDKGIRFADLNGDGLVDMIASFENSSEEFKNTWLNTGRGWQLNNSWGVPELFMANGFNKGRRLADIDGNGLVDIIVAYATDPDDIKYSVTKQRDTPYLLKSITTEYGGVTSLNYTSSSIFNNSEDGVSDIGFNIFVVNNVTMNNSLEGDFRVYDSFSYNYSFGKFDYGRQEFRGFGVVVEKNPAAALWHYFHQDNARRGKEHRIAVYDHNGTLFKEERTSFNTTQSETGIFNVTLDHFSVYLYDGNYTNPTVTNKTFTYDSSGNVLVVRDEGDVSLDGDERTFNYSYAQNSDDWIMDRVARSVVYDDENVKVKESLFYYDDLGLRGVSDKGALTKTEEWNSEGNNTFTYVEYDAFGNVQKQTDSLGNSISYDYDVTYTYPILTTNALGHVTKKSYDPCTLKIFFRKKKKK